MIIARFSGNGAEKRAREFAAANDATVKFAPGDSINARGDKYPKVIDGSTWQVIAEEPSASPQASDDEKAAAAIEAARTLNEGDSERNYVFPESSNSAGRALKL